MPLQLSKWEKVRRAAGQAMSLASAAGNFADTEVNASMSGCMVWQGAWDLVVKVITRPTPTLPLPCPGTPFGPTWNWRNVCNGSADHSSGCVAPSRQCGAGADSALAVRPSWGLAAYSECSFRHVHHTSAHCMLVPWVLWSSGLGPKSIIPVHYPWLLLH